MAPGVVSPTLLVEDIKDSWIYNRLKAIIATQQKKIHMAIPILNFIFRTPKPKCDQQNTIFPEPCSR